MKRIPIICDFCGQVSSRNGNINYDVVCAQCRRPNEPETVLVPVPIALAPRRAA